MAAAAARSLLVSGLRGGAATSPDADSDDTESRSRRAARGDRRGPSGAATAAAAPEDRSLRSCFSRAADFALHAAEHSLLRGEKKLRRASAQP